MTKKRHVIALFPVLLVLLYAIMTTHAVLGDDCLQAKLNELKKIHAKKLSEYNNLLNIYKSLESDVNSMFTQLSLLRIGIFALGALFFAIGFFIGCKHEKKVVYRREKQ